jgi:hypothetical protein
LYAKATLFRCHYPDLDQLNDVEFSYHVPPPIRHPAQAKNLFPAFNISRNQVQSHQVLTLLQLNPLLQLPRRRQGAHTRASSQPRDRNKSRLPDLATPFLALVPYATQSIQMQGPNKAAYACARDLPRIFDVVSCLRRGKSQACTYLLENVKTTNRNCVCCARHTEVAKKGYVDGCGLPARCAVENGPLRCGATDKNHGSIDDQTTSAGGA